MQLKYNPFLCGDLLSCYKQLEDVVDDEDNDTDENDDADASWNNRGDEDDKDDDRKEDEWKRAPVWA